MAGNVKVVCCVPARHSFLWAPEVSCVDYPSKARGMMYEAVYQYHVERDSAKPEDEGVVLALRGDAFSRIRMYVGVPPRMLCAELMADVHELWSIDETGTSAFDFHRVLRNFKNPSPPACDATASAHDQKICYMEVEVTYNLSVVALDATAMAAIGWTSQRIDGVSQGEHAKLSQNTHESKTKGGTSAASGGGDEVPKGETPEERATAEAAESSQWNAFTAAKRKDPKGDYPMVTYNYVAKLDHCSGKGGGLPVQTLPPGIIVPASASENGDPGAGDLQLYTPERGWRPGMLPIGAPSFRGENGKRRSDGGLFGQPINDRLGMIDSSKSPFRGQANDGGIVAVLAEFWARTGPKHAVNAVALPEWPPFID